MHGSSYIWGFLVPASILLFVGFYLSAQLSGSVKLTAALQIDQRARNKIIKRRGLQIGLFFKVVKLKQIETSRTYLFETWEILATVATLPWHRGCLKFESISRLDVALL